MPNDTSKNQGPPGLEFNEQSYKKKLSFALTMLLLFCVTYFTAAVIATRDFKHIASIPILGLPLALYTGVLVFVIGLIVTRMCLVQDKGGKS